MKRKFLAYIDIDSFFVSAEKILRKNLQSEDIVISSQHLNSIVSSISNSLKKKGAKAGTKVKDIKKVSKNLLTIYPNISYYKQLADKINLFLEQRFTRLEVKSIDEWIVEIDNIKNYQQAFLIMRQTQDDIKSYFGIEISIGISYNCFLAKIGSKLNKPFGIKIIKDKDDIKKYIWNLDISEYHGIGKKKISILKNEGIKTIGDLAKTSEFNPLIRKLFLNCSKEYIDNANGIGDDIIKTNKNMLSISKTNVFKRGPTTDINYIYSILNTCALQLSQSLKRKSWKAKSISIIINKKFAHWPLVEHISSSEDIFYFAKKAFIENWDEENIFMCGIKLTKLELDINTNQRIEIISLTSEKSDLIVNKVNSVKGKKLLFKAKDLLEY